MSLLSKIGNALGSIGGVVGGALGSTPLGTALSAGSSALSGLTASVDNDKNLSKQMQFNSSEAEKARQFNAQQSQLANEFSAKEAEKSRAWSEAMWQKQADYDSASAQLKRLSDAGINPNLLGNELMNTTAMPSGASATGVAASSPTSNASLAPSSSALAAQTSANTLLANAQAKKLEADTKRTLGLHELDAMLANGTIALQNSTINLQSSQRDVNKKQLLAIDATISKIDEECANIKQSTALLNAQTHLTELQGKEREAYVSRITEIVDASINQMLSQISANKATAALSLANIAQVKEQILNLLTARKGQEYTNKVLWYEWKLKNHTFKTSVDLANATNSAQKIGFDFQNAHTDYSTAVNAVNFTISALGNILNQIGNIGVAGAAILK